MNGKELREIYDTYLEEAERAEQKLGPFSGMFGIGKKASDDPCHDRFVANVEAWIRAFRETEPDSASVRNIMGMIFRLPKEHSEPQSAYWIMMGVQSFAQQLIPLLEPEDAAALSAEYTGLYKRWERMPAQKQILDALKKASKRQ